MIREVGAGVIPPEKHFRWRGGEITRLEALTDGVFALAVTLLIVSLEVPKTFSQLELLMKGFAPFAMCFFLLVQIWHSHYIYSRRYGLQTPYSVFLNSALLFVVLFYVYPLKFLFTLTMGGLFGATTVPEREFRMMIEDSQVPELMIIFSLGYTAVFTVFALLYRYAYGKRRELDLNEYESLRTRHDMIQYAVSAGVGLLTATTAALLPANRSYLSIWLFFLAMVYALAARPSRRKKEKLALERVQAAETAATAGAAAAAAQP